MSRYLLANAVKFTERGEVVLSVEARQKDGDGRGNHHQQPDEENFYELHFAVRDTGIGISEEGNARLFRSFSQVDASTNRRYGGTGLGLAISKRLAELMDGTMWAESQPGVGTTFHFTMLAEATPTGSRPYLDTSQPQLVGKRVLIVNDNATNRFILTLQMQSWGMLPYACASGQEALAYLQATVPFDVVILDMQMPDMDGLEASRAIHEGWPAEQRPRIVAMTANAMQGDREECLDAGMDDYLTKPVQIKALQAALERSGWWAKKRTLPLEEPGKVALPTGDAESEVQAAPALDPAVLSELRQFQGEGEPDIVQELAEAFQFETPPLLEALRQAIVEGQPEQLKWVAHNLRGSSNNLGARTMAALSAEGEVSHVNRR